MGRGLYRITKMAILMQHPKHGFMHAYNTVEQKTLEGRGWTVKKDRPVEIAPEVEDEAIRQAYFNKFGKKPHHMMKIENILKALNDS